MAPDKTRTESSGGETGSDTISPEVEDAACALDKVSIRDPTRTQPAGKGRKPSVGLEEANKGADGAVKDDGINLLLDGIKSLVPSLPPLVKALETIAQIHPFVSIVVGAFKVVVELEIKRRDNDKKVNLLFLEMKNMMSVLLQLQGVSAEHIAKDGVTVSTRLSDLITRTANDIKECANVCDTYSKKRLLVKVLKGPIWDDTLKGFIQLFVDRKTAFNFAISIHTGMGIDRANNQLDALMIRQHICKVRVELILKFFVRCVPPSQRTLKTMVDQTGGPDVAAWRPDILQNLINHERSYEQAPVDSYGSPYSPIPANSYSTVRPVEYSRVTGKSGRGFYSGYDYPRAAENVKHSRRRSRFRAGLESQPERGDSKPYIPTAFPGQTPEVVYVGVPRSPRPSEPGRRASGFSRPGDSEELPREKEISMLQQELMQAPSADIKKNMQTFERKFELQMRELAMEMKGVVAHEGDRIIDSVLAGPHAKIIDRDLREIWKEMRWRGIVKARHLVLAICDYYLQKEEDQEHATQSGGDDRDPEARRIIEEKDTWTLQCIDLMHVHPIIEALDADASGYITIQEVNQFTTSRPQGWSLLHWLAYWAVGWRVCMTVYRGKILSTLDSMSNLVEKALTHNKIKIRGYLDITRRLVANMVQSFQADTDLLFLLPHFQAYMDENEARLQKALETAKYQIDALDTIALIIGRKGPPVERNVFPLLHLLLSRHYDVMKLGGWVVLHMDELIDAAESINIVQDAFDMRRNELSGLFRQRRLWVSQDYSDVAHGMFSSLGYMPELAFNSKYSDEDDTYKPNEEVPKSTSILKYPAFPSDLYLTNEHGVLPGVFRYADTVGSPQLSAGS